MAVRPVPIPVTSPLYPLPGDYPSLTAEGMRQARVNASRQWLLPGTLLECADRLVASTWFFDSYYLVPDPESDFDPGFYDVPPLETPEFHWDISRTWAMNRLNVCMAPRGGAKSTHNRKDMILRLTTAPMYSFVYATSTHDNAKHTGQLIRDQAYSNLRIHEDFTPEYKVDSLKPTRGDRPTGVEYFFLNNGSWVRCVSAESRLRGLRPRRFRLDDPEYDEKASTSMQTIRDYMDRLLFKVAIPMVMRAECGIDWVGTFVSKRHFLWHAMAVKQTSDGPRAEDRRFDHWSRLFIRGAYEKNGKLVSCWPSMWPLTRADKEAAGNPQLVSLEEMKEMMGVTAFNNEVLGRPGESEEQFFKIDPSVNGRHSWWFESPDNELVSDPYLSTTKICWTHPDGHTDRVPLGAWLLTVKLFITVDTAYTEKATSDRRCCCLMAVTRDNELFVLDMWSDKKGDDVLVKKSLSMAEFWRCPLICVEVVKESFKTLLRFKSVVATRMTEELGMKFVPRIRDMRPGTISKTDKISTLDLRFEHGLIKLPTFRRYEHPWFTRLFDQIESFNPEADDGGLEKDDELDCVSMSLFVIKSKLLKSEAPETEKPINPIEELKKGNAYLPGGAPIGMGLDLSTLDREVVGSLLANAHRRDQETSANAPTTRV